MLGQWQEHLPFGRAIAVESGNNKIYCATKSGLFLLPSEVIVRTPPTELPPEIRNEIAKRGAADVLADIKERERIALLELAYWRKLRNALREQQQRE